MLDFLLNKKVKEFNSNLKTVRQLIRSNKFAQAAEYYNLLNKTFNHIPKKKRTVEMSKAVNLVYNEIRLYMDINEAYHFAELGDISKLHYELNKIHDLVYELNSINYKEVPPLIKATEKYYKFLTKVYYFKASKKHFVEHYNLISNYLSNMKIAEATKEIAHLILFYQRLLPLVEREDRLELYGLLKSLFKELSIKKLLKKAHLRSLPIYEVPLRIEVPRHQDAIVLPKLNLDFSRMKFPLIYKKVVNFIKRDKYYESFGHFEGRLMEEFFPKGMFYSGFKVNEIQIPHHENFIVLPNLELTSTVMYSKQYDKIHRLLLKGKFADAVELYEKEITHNYIPKSFLKPMKIDKIKMPRHEKNISLPHLNKVDSLTSFPDSYDEVESLIREEKYFEAIDEYNEDLLKDYIPKSMFTSSFKNPKIDVPHHEKEVRLPHVKTQERVRYPTEIETLHRNLVSNRLSQPRIELPKVSLHKRKIVIPKIKTTEVISYPKEFSLVHKKLEKGNYKSALRIFEGSKPEREKVTFNKMKISKPRIAIKENKLNVVHYSSKYHKLNRLLKKGDYEKAVKIYNLL